MPSSVALATNFSTVSSRAIAYGACCHGHFLRFRMNFPWSFPSHFQSPLALQRDRRPPRLAAISCKCWFQQTDVTGARILHRRCGCACSIFAYLWKTRLATRKFIGPQHHAQSCWTCSCLYRGAGCSIKETGPASRRFYLQQRGSP